MFAHGGGAGGPNPEAAVLAVAMVVVGGILFVQKSAKPIVSAMLVLGGVAVGWGGSTFLGPDDDHDDGRAVAQPNERYPGAVEGLCDARHRLAEDDVTGARTSFYDDSHAALHDIADLLAEEDRTTAAGLLESKAAVESGLDGAGDLPSLQRDLDELIIATVRGLAEIDIEVAGCE